MVHESLLEEDNAEEGEALLAGADKVTDCCGWCNVGIQYGRLSLSKNLPLFI